MLPDVLRDGAKLAYIIASEGIVLLKNNGVLPLNRDAKIAVWEVLSTGLGDITYMLDVQALVVLVFKPWCRANS
jgi:beta-glucosidase (EC:3.2.1.21)